MEMLVPDAMRDAHLGHRAGDEADPQPRPLGAGRQLAGCRRDASTFPARVSLSTIDEEGRDHAGRIVEASEQVATLIDDLLRLSRLSRAEVHLHAVDLGRRGHPYRRGTPAQ